MSGKLKSSDEVLVLQIMVLLEAIESVLQTQPCRWLGLGQQQLAEYPDLKMWNLHWHI